jgi:nucleoid-associated protein YgaU
MAKKRTTSGAEAKPKKAAAAGAAKKATKAAKPAEGPAKKAAAPKATKAAKAAKPAGAAPKKKAPAAPVKITDKQKELLTKIQGAGELGYKPEKAEGRGLNSLKEKKLVKGVRNKDTKEVHALLTKAGEKALAPPKA